MLQLQGCGLDASFASRCACRVPAFGVVQQHASVGPRVSETSFLGAEWQIEATIAWFMVAASFRCIAFLVDLQKTKNKINTYPGISRCTRTGFCLSRHAYPCTSLRIPDSVRLKLSAKDHPPAKLSSHPAMAACVDPQQLPSLEMIMFGL